MNPPIVSLNLRCIRRRNKHRSCLLCRFHWHTLRWRTFRHGWCWVFNLRCHQRRHWHIPCQRCWCSLPWGLPKINAFSCFGRVWNNHGLRIRRAGRRHYTLRTRPRSLYRLRCGSNASRGLRCSLVNQDELASCFAGFGVTGDNVRPCWRGFNTGLRCPLVLSFYHRRPGIRGRRSRPGARIWRNPNWRNPNTLSRTRHLGAT